MSKIDNFRKIRKVAVIDPIGFRGGQFRAIRLLSEAILLGSRAAGTPVEVVIGYIDSNYFRSDELIGTGLDIKKRAYSWRVLNAAEARRALVYAGRPVPHKLAPEYQIPDDGINQFYDCDILIFISDRLLRPILPIKPYVLVVYDYLQRYFPKIIPEEANNAFIEAARNANGVLVTTRFTEEDALQYAGIPSERVHKVPMIAPHLKKLDRYPGTHEDKKYFIWTTNLAIHKNHVNAVKALRIYYEQLEGTLHCLVTGFGSQLIVKSDFPHLMPVKEMFAQSLLLKRNVKLLGDLADEHYQKALANAHFLWHPCKLDNGTFCVVEAAYLGVPSLSSNYPAMHEMNDFYDLSLNWCDPDDPQQMALELKRMEQEADERRKLLPSQDNLESKGLAFAASRYWEAIQKCL